MRESRIRGRVGRPPAAAELFIIPRQVSAGAGGKSGMYHGSPGSGHAGTPTRLIVFPGARL